jgi:hypothetical protein
MQHYVIKFVSDLRQVGGFLRLLRFPPPIKLTPPPPPPVTEILLKVALNSLTPFYIAILYSIFNSIKLMTYLFWFPKKTIYFFSCLLNLLDQLWYFSPKSNSLYTNESTFLPSSQLTRSIHWPCNCTVHVYVSFFIFVIVCGYSRVETNLCRLFIVWLYLFYHWKSNYQQGRVVISLTNLTLPQLLWLFQVRTWISDTICCGLILCSTIWGERWL